MQHGIVHLGCTPAAFLARRGAWVRVPLCCTSRASNSPDRKAAATSDRLALRHLRYDDLASESAGYRLMRNRTEWVAFWERYWTGHQGPNAPMPSPPDFDFTREMLLGVGSGAHSGCGNFDEIIINHVDAKGDTLTVLLGPTALDSTLRATCMMMVSPVDVVLLPRTSGHLSFRTAFSDSAFNIRELSIGGKSAR